MVLMYWREYRTFEHIGETYGVSEATVCRTVKQFENILIKDKRFHLPGKKALTQSETVFELIAAQTGALNERAPTAAFAETDECPATLVADRTGQLTPYFHHLVRFG